MKDLLKDKWMIGFMTAVLLLTYVTSLNDRKIDQQKKELEASTQQVQINKFVK